MDIKYSLFTEKEKPPRLCKTMTHRRDDDDDGGLCSDSDDEDEDDCKKALLLSLPSS